VVATIHRLGHQVAIDRALWDRTEGSRFSDEAVDGFIERFRATLRYAGIISDLAAAMTENKIGQLDTQKNESDPETPRREVRVGSFVQWTSNGVDQFSQPMKVVGTHAEWAFVEGSKTGVPTAELSVVDPPAASSQSAPPPNPFFKPPASEADEQPTAANCAKAQTKLDEGTAVLIWPDELSMESVEALEYWLNGVIRRARRKAGLPAQGQQA
jgi:hypothetical protein